MQFAVRVLKLVECIQQSCHSEPSEEPRSRSLEHAPLDHMIKQAV